VSYSISVKGTRLLSRVNLTQTGKISLLKSLNSTDIKVQPKGIGKIKITVTAKNGNESTVTKTANAFLLGPFVLNVQVQ
jgi:hypothetical protein